MSRDREDGSRMSLAVCDACHARYEGRREPTTPGSRMDYGGYNSHSSGGIEVGPKLYMNLVACSWVRFGFRGWKVLEGSISVGRFHDRRKGCRRVVGCEGICARPVVLWDAERKLGHYKSSRIGVSIDDHQARIELGRWRPGWGVESASLSMETTAVYDSSLNSSHPFYDTLPSYWRLSRSGSGPGRGILCSSLFPRLHQPCQQYVAFQQKKAIADHPSVAYSLVHITKAVVDTGASQTEDPTALILGMLVFSCFSSWPISNKDGR